MARNSDEHKMLFDIRSGRRQVVIKVVYAVLAILMALSLFLVTGAVNLGSIFGGNGSSGASPATTYEERATRIERELAKKPDDEALLLSLTRNRITAAKLLAGEVSDASDVEAVRTQDLKASEAWSKYVDVAAEPSPGMALQAAPALFQLAELARSGAEAQENIAAATEAQEIVAKARPSLNSLSTLAEYQLFNFDFGPAKATNEEASKFAEDKFTRENLENRYEEIEKSARKFQSGIKAEEKAQKEAAKAGKESGSPESNPLETGGLGGTGLGG